MQTAVLACRRLLPLCVNTTEIVSSKRRAEATEGLATMVCLCRSHVLISHLGLLSQRVPRLSFERLHLCAPTVLLLVCAVSLMCACLERALRVPR